MDPHLESRNRIGLNVLAGFPPDRTFYVLLSVTYLAIIHVFMPNLGGVVYRQIEYLIWLVSGSMVLISTLKVLSERILRKSVFTVHILIFMLCWVGSVTFSRIVNLEYFLIRSIWLLGGFLIWLSFGQFENKGRERLLILNLIYISCVIQATIGIMQFFGLWKYLPIPPYYANGTFQQRNLFASYLSTGLVISLYFVSTTWVGNFGRIRKILFFRVCF